MVIRFNKIRTSGFINRVLGGRVTPGASFDCDGLASDDRRDKIHVVHAEAHPACDFLKFIHVESICQVLVVFNVCRNVTVPRPCLN